MPTGEPYNPRKGPTVTRTSPALAALPGLLSGVCVLLRMVPGPEGLP